MEIPVQRDGDHVVYDFDQATAAEAEVASNRFVRIGGKEVPLPSSAKVPLDAVALLQRGEADVLVMRLFGEDDGRHIAAHMTFGGLEALLNVIMGSDDALGELQASTT